MPEPPGYRYMLVSFHPSLPLRWRFRFCPCYIFLLCLTRWNSSLPPIFHPGPRQRGGQEREEVKKNATGHVSSMHQCTHRFPSPHGSSKQDITFPSRPQTTHQENFPISSFPCFFSSLSAPEGAPKEIAPRLCGRSSAGVCNLAWTFRKLNVVALATL